MKRLGIPFDDSMGISVDKVVFIDNKGTTYDTRDTVRVMSSWGRVYRSLRDMLPAECYRLGMNLVNIEQDSEGVTAIFANGTRERGDLLVGADGGRSTVRKLARGLLWLSGGCLCLYALVAARYFLPAPTLSHNYAAELNAANSAAHTSRGSTTASLGNQRAARMPDVAIGAKYRAPATVSSSM